MTSPVLPDIAALRARHQDDGGVCLVCTVEIEDDLAMWGPAPFPCEIIQLADALEDAQATNKEWEEVAVKVANATDQAVERSKAALEREHKFAVELAVALAMARAAVNDWQWIDQTAELDELLARPEVQALLTEGKEHV